MNKWIVGIVVGIAVLIFGILLGTSFIAILGSLVGMVSLSGYIFSKIESN